MISYLSCRVGSETVTVSPLYKLSENQRHSLGTIAFGSAFFGCMYAVTRFVKISLCPIFTFFGHQCIGCGLSRGILAFVRGDISGAFSHHILSIPVFIAVVIYYSICLYDLIFETRWRRIEKYLASKPLFLLYFLLFVGVFLWNISRQ